MAFEPRGRKPSQERKLTSRGEVPVQFVMTTEEWAIFSAHTNKLNVSMSGYIRGLIGADIAAFEKEANGG